MNLVMRKINYMDLGIIDDWKVEGFPMDIYYENYKNQSELIGPDKAVAFVLASQTDIIGLIEFFFDKSGYATISILRNPSPQWKGYGKIIMKKGLKTLSNDLDYNKEYIKAWVRTDNYPALNLLTRYGFLKENNPLFNINKRILFYYYY